MSARFPESTRPDVALSDRRRRPARGWGAPSGPGELTLTSLSLDVASITEPRELLDNARTAFASIEGDEYRFEFPELGVPGEANPITGAPLVLDMALATDFRPDPCGMVTGSVTDPIIYDLKGSTFAIVEIGDGPYPDDLPACANK